MASITVNKQRYKLDHIDPQTPLLWVLRDELGLVGAKYGCGVAQCGACTVHIDGSPTRSCVLPIAALEGKNITTLEGLATNGDLTPVQQAWVDVDVPQCGYCQAGQIMSASALLAQNNSPSDDEIKSAMAGNICRCGTYPRIVEAIKLAAKNSA